MSLINDALKRASQSSKRHSTDGGAPPNSPLEPVVGGRPRGGQINLSVLIISILILLVIGGATWGFLSWRKRSNAAPEQLNASKPVEKAAVDQAPAKTKTTSPPPVASPAATPPAKSPPPAAEPVKVVAQAPRSTPVASPPPPPTEKAPVVSKSAKPQPAATTQPASGKTPKPVSTNPSSGTTSVATPRKDPPKSAGDPKAGGPSTEQAFPAIKLQGIAFRIKNPSVLINGKVLLLGEVLSLGEDVEGIVVKKIERSSVTLEWQGQKKVFSLN